MVNTGVLSPEDVRKGQEKIKEEIYARAKELGISTDDHEMSRRGDLFTIQQLQ